MNKSSGTRYTKEFKEAAVARMMHPDNESIKSISDELGVSDQSLYKWRQKARIEGSVMPGNRQTTGQWSSEDKFLIVLETYAMNQAELSEYCRKKGLYNEQIDAWRVSCLNANTGELNQTKKLSQELKEEKKRTSEIERDLQFKEKALAEAAALLLLRKKARAIWGDQEDE